MAEVKWQARRTADSVLVDVTADVDGTAIVGVANAIEGGGAISATDGVTTVNPATSIVFPSGTIADLGGGVAGIGLILRQIGPFAVAFDTPDISPPGLGAKVWDVPAGTLVLRAWAEIDPVWLGPDTATMQIWLGPSDQWDDGTWLPISIHSAKNINTIYDLATGLVLQTITEGEPIFVAGAGQTTGRFMAGRAVTTNALGVYVTTTGSAAVGGSADIYAIIATPAS